MTETTTTRMGEDPRVVAAIRDGTEAQFAALVEPHRHELHVHCYRMLANLDDAEDATQETFIKAAGRGSKGVRRHGRGCTASPPTPASTRSGGSGDAS